MNTPHSFIYHQLRVAMAVTGCLAAIRPVAAAPAGRPDIVIGDFESGTYEGWTVEGEAFGTAPIPASVVSEWREDRRPAGWQGNFLAVTGEMRHANNPDGRLISNPFEIDRRYVRFLLGGEVRPDVRVLLEVDGRPVRVAYGNNSYDLRLRGWDVSEFAGRTGRIIVQDTAADPSLIRGTDASSP